MRVGCLLVVGVGVVLLIRLREGVVTSVNSAGVLTASSLTRSWCGHHEATEVDVPRGIGGVVRRRGGVRHLYARRRRRRGLVRRVYGA